LLELHELAARGNGVKERTLKQTMLVEVSTSWRLASIECVKRSFERSKRQKGGRIELNGRCHQKAEAIILGSIRVAGTERARAIAIIIVAGQKVVKYLGSDR